jgi:hypothetical protein
MLALGASPRVFVATGPVDMRGSSDTLAGYIRRLHGDPLGTGNLFSGRDQVPDRR